MVSWVSWKESTSVCPDKPHLREELGGWRKGMLINKLGLERQRWWSFGEGILSRNHSDQRYLFGSVVVLRVNENFLRLCHKQEVISSVGGLLLGNTFCFTQFTFSLFHPTSVYKVFSYSVNQCASYSKPVKSLELCLRVYVSILLKERILKVYFLEHFECSI